MTGPSKLRAVVLAMVLALSVLVTPLGIGVVGAAGNGPTAVANASPTTPSVGQTVAYDASASTGSSLTYAWDFDGDSTWDSTEQNPQHSYASAGTYVAVLRVSDGTSTALDDVTIEVTAGSDLTATASADPTSGEMPLSVQFTGGASGGRYISRSG